MSALGRHAGALFLTMGVEAGAAAVLGVRSARGFLTTLLANTLTNPLAFTAAGMLLQVSSRSAPATRAALDAAVVLTVEAAVTITEARFYKRFPPGQRCTAAVFSLALNAASFFAGIAAGF